MSHCPGSLAPKRLYIYPWASEPTYTQLQFDPHTVLNPFLLHSPSKHIKNGSYSKLSGSHCARHRQQHNQHCSHLFNLLNQFICLRHCAKQANLFINKKADVKIGAAIPDWWHLHETQPRLLSMSFSLCRGDVGCRCFSPGSLICAVHIGLPSMETIVLDTWNQLQVFLHQQFPF